MAFKDAFNVDTATRDVIFDRNLALNTPANRAVRQALGFRETSLGATRPKFRSQAVQELYTAIDELSKTHLPVESIDKLHSAWHKGTLIQSEISELVEKYGYQIWGEPMDRRHLTSNPQSHLLVEGEGDGFYSTDLFIELRNHRAYIKLQLEHLAYVKAIMYYRNHHHKRPGGERAAARPTRILRSTVGKTPSNSPRSLIVVFSLPSNELSKLLIDPKKRKHQAQNDKTYRPSGRRRIEKSNPEDEPPSTQGNRRFVTLNADELNNTPWGFKTTLDGALGVRSHTAPPTTMHNQHGYEQPQRGMFHNQPNENPPFVNANKDSVAKGNKDGPANFNQDKSTGPNQDESNAGNEDEEMLDIDLVYMRAELGALLVGELCDITQSHSRLEDTDKMWEKSRQLDDTFKTVWEADENKNRSEMGEERYGKIKEVVHEWIVWRDNARKLGTKAGVHPSQGRPIPQFTVEEWVEKLGGKRAYQEMDYQLHVYRGWLRKSGTGISKTDFAEHLAVAFASAIEYSSGVDAFKTMYLEDIISFNEKLFSWTLDFKS